ncbi:MAG TPA: phosphodiesterase [Firmicutes bacterium]|nr:phosphodiesterase [Bacillota bacterium]
MIDLDYARRSFKKFLDRYEDKEKLGFNLKVVHTYHVVDMAKSIASNLNLSEEDKDLAELIALLHDIGRFEELNFFNKFNSTSFNHASYGVKMLFEDEMIRDFIIDDKYDEIIKTAILNHNRLCIENGLDERCKLHAMIIRDADKLDNFRVKKEEKIEAIFPGKVKEKKDMENSILSDKVYETIKKAKCVNIRDRETVLDYWCCVLAFVFDLNFKESYEIIKNNDYINLLIDRFKYNDLETKKRIEEIRNIMNAYVSNKVGESDINEQQ